MGNARRNEPDAPFAAEAKDYLRNAAIGQYVTVHVDYEREGVAAPGAPEGEKMPARVFATISLMKPHKAKGVLVKDLGEAMVAQGFATVIRHRAEEARAQHYDDMLTAETKAQAQKKRLHASQAKLSAQADKSSRYTDLTTNVQQAKNFAPFLKRDIVGKGAINATIEYVTSGHRYKIFLPKENCLINFQLNGITTPQNYNPNPKANAISKEELELGNKSRSFARQHLMQRNVSVEVLDIDKGGRTGFGFLKVIPAGQSTTNVAPVNGQSNFANQLLLNGLAKGDDYIYDAPKQYSSQMLKAQEQAQTNQVGVWSKEYRAATATEDSKSEGPNKTPFMGMSGLKSALDALESAQAKAPWVPVSVAEIGDANRLYLHVKSNADQLKQMESQMSKFTDEHGTHTGKPVEVKRGKVVAALFDEGNGPQWFRAKIEAISGQNVRVRFLEYGNVATLTMQHLSPLEGHPSLKATPPQAIPVSFAAVKAPRLDEDFGHEAAHMVHDSTWGKSDLKMRVVGVDPTEVSSLGPVLLVELSVGDNNVSLGVIQAGLMRLNQKQIKVLRKAKSVNVNALNTFVEEAEGAQNKALRARACMWQYGDVQSDDEEY